MDKSEAKKRLDAIEREAKELRAIIERGDTEEYDYEKLYVAEIFGDVYLLFGKTKGDVLCRDGEEEAFYWLSFENHPSQQIWSSNGTTAKEALAIAKREGILYSFTNHKDGMAFFAKRYAALT